MKSMFITFLIFVASLTARVSTQKVEGTTSSPLGKNEVEKVNYYSINQSPILLCNFLTLSYDPKIVWKKDGEIIQDSPKFRITKKASEDPALSTNPLFEIFNFKMTYTTLKISEAQKEDTGRYSCEVSNSPQKETLKNEFNIQVDEPKPVIREVNTNLPAVLVCAGNFDYPASVSWYKNDSPLPEDSRYKHSQRVTKLEEVDDRFAKAGIHLKLHVFSLVVYSAQKKDAGNYTCRLHNPETEQYYEEKFQLKIIDNEPTKLDLSVGNLPRFFCEFKTQHPAIVIWQKEGQTLRNGTKYIINNPESRLLEGILFSDMGINIYLSASKLVIPNVALEDAGNYTCIDKNPLNHNLEMEFVLNVTEKEKSERIGEIGGAANLVCQHRLRFSPRVVWLKDGKLLPQNDRILVINHEEKIAYPPQFGLNSPIRSLFSTIKHVSLLQILDLQPEDQGVYTCSVENNPIQAINYDQDISLIVKE